MSNTLLADENVDNETARPSMKKQEPWGRALRGGA